MPKGRNGLEKIWLAGLVGTVLSLVFCPPLQADNCRGLKVVLRHDDFTATSPLELETKYFLGLEKIGAKIVVGVVPFSERSVLSESKLSLGDAKISLLKSYEKRGIAQIAAHGFSHHNNSKKSQKSEFVDLPFSRQLDLLSAAKASLESTFGAGVSTFIPPWNQHDEATLSALVGSGFTVLSSSRTAPTDANVPLKYLPGTVYPQNFSKTVRLATQGWCDGIIVVTSHPYDFDEGASLPSFRHGPVIKLQEFLREISMFVVAGKIEVRSIDELLEEGEELGPKRLAGNLRLAKSFVTKHRLLPESFGLYPISGLYYSEAEIEKLLKVQWLAASGIYGPFAIIAAVIGFRLSGESRVSACVCTASSMIIAIAAAIAVIGPANIFAKLAVVMVSLGGGATGVFLSAVKQLVAKESKALII